MKRLVSLAALFVFCASAFAETQTYRATVREASVYLSGATLYQTVSIPVKDGAQEIVIEGLSASIDQASLKVKAPGVLISSSEYYAGIMADEAAASKVASLKSELSELNSSLASLNSSLSVDKKMLELLAEGINNQLKSASTSEISEKLEAYRKNAEVLNESILAKKSQIAELTSRIDALNAELKTASSALGRKCGMLRLNVTSSNAKDVEFEISYFINNARWSPKYELSVKSLNEAASLKAKAVVSQNTGLDWNNVKLTLTNGRPGKTNYAPTLSAWFLRFREEIYRVNMLKSAAYSLDDYDMALTCEAASMDEYVELTETAINVSYAIDLPYNVSGDGKNQSIELKNYELPAEYYYYAVPKISDEVYLMAKLSDWEKYNLLPGESVVSYDGTFIGKSYINPSSTDTELLLTLGSDSRITTSRQLASEGKSTKLIGSTTQKTFSWTINVKNNKNTPVKLRVVDQYPVSTDKDIEVSLTKTSPAATIDAASGLITWELDLAAGQARTLDFSYSVKYPKDKTLQLE